MKEALGFWPSFLIIKGPAHFLPQGVVGRHLGGVAFAQVDDVVQGDDRGDQFIEEMNALQGRDIEHLAVIEEAAPEGPGLFGQAVGGLVFQEKQALALGAGIEEPADIVFRPAFETAVDQVAFRLRDEKRADVVGELFGFQGASRLKHRLEACATKKYQAAIPCLIKVGCRPV